MIAAYMVFSGLFDSGSDALDHFAEKRSKIDRGVAQPSQRRFPEMLRFFLFLFSSFSSKISIDFHIVSFSHYSFEELSGIVLFYVLDRYVHYFGEMVSGREPVRRVSILFRSNSSGCGASAPSFSF